MKKVNSSFGKDNTVSSLPFVKNNKWINFVDTTDKKNPPVHRLWRELDDNNILTFNRYGIGIAKFTEGKHVYYRCYIGYKNWNKGGYAQGKKCRSLSEAYDDLKETVVCVKKSFQFDLPLKDRVLTQAWTDKQDMLDAAKYYHID